MAEPEIGQRLAELIKHLRSGQGVRAFGRAVGVAHDTILRWESGSANIRSVTKLANYIGSNEKELMAYLEGHCTLAEYLQGRDVEQAPLLTVNRVLRWLPGLDLSDLAAIAYEATRLIAEQTRPKTIQSLIERKLAETDLQQLAEEANLDEAELQSILEGNCPSPAVIAALAQVLEWSEAALSDLVQQQYQENDSQS